MPKAILTEQGGKGGGGGGVTLQRITVTTPPTNKTYVAGQSFNPAGMVVTAAYGIGGTTLAEVEVSGYVVTPDPLVDGTTAVTISYSEIGVTVKTTTPVTVYHALQSITVDTLPTKTTYEYQDTLATAGMVVKAHYSDNAVATVTGWSCSPTALNTVTNAQTITVSYTERGITKTTTFNVVVNRKSIAVPTWKANVNYNGSQYNVNNTNYWDGYDSSKMSIGGTYTGTNANTYSATFTPGSNYRWSSDLSTGAKTVNWTINKINDTITPSVTSLEITKSNLSKEFTVTKSGGTLSASVSPTTGVTVSVNGTTVTVTGNGTTAGTFTITLSTASTTNYNATTGSQTVTVTAKYFEWGSETATADATWWADLKDWVASATDAQLQGCLGKTKSVTLTTAVQGTTTHLVRCIGWNCDGNKTLTFHTANCLANTTVFGSSNGLWVGSTVRNLCTTYYNAFPGKNSIKEVSKGTCASTNSSQSGTPTYNNEKVFLPSDCEMGFPKGHDYSNGKGYAASYDEFCQANTSKTAYQWYTTNERRIKKQGDSGSALYYWERSLGYGGTSDACRVRTDGKPYGGNYGGSHGFAPAFVIG